MEIEVRRVRPEDYPATEHVMREAFWNHFVPGCDEHYLLHTMRTCSAFVPELDLVATADDDVVGNVVCMRSVIEGDDGETREVLTLGPIAVLPTYQSAGVGAALIERTKVVARSLGFGALMLCGDPAYYARRGFIPAESLGIRTADDAYAVALQACELSENALAGAAGRYVEDDVYEVDEDAAAAYDRAFPVKERVAGTPSQQRFQELVVQRRDATAR